jgi:hypothetical protein
VRTETQRNVFDCNTCTRNLNLTGVIFSDLYRVNLRDKTRTEDGKNLRNIHNFYFQNIIRFVKPCTVNWQDERRRWEMRKKFNPKEEGNQRLGTPGSWWEENTRIDFTRTDVRARTCYIQLKIGSSSWYCEKYTEEPVSTEGSKILNR